MKNLQTYGFVRSTILLFALASPALLCAQFQQPTDEELKMTSDPKAPGAAAVYLYREETTDDNLHFHSYYERIKVLTEKGKELATIKIPYEHGEFQITNIKGQTIHSDGTVVPLTARPEDLMDVKTRSSQVNQIVFTLPSVEVGSIIEYRLQMRYSDNIVSSPTWDIQQPFFVRKAHYSFIAAGGTGTITNSRGQALNRIMWTTSGIPTDRVVQDALGHFSVDVADVPAIPNDDWMPPLNTLKWRVEFYYTYAHSGVDYWDSEGKRWAKDTEHFANVSGALKEAVSQIVAPTDTEEQKARKIYAAVQKLDNTRFTRRKSEAERKAEKLKAVKDAEDVWKQQSGTDDEITLLYVAMARAAGLKVWPMKVADRTRAIFDPRFLSVGQLDDYIAIVDLGGKDVYLDPGQKMCPFGVLDWKHSLASGFRLTEKGTTIATTPATAYNADVVERVAELAIDSAGAVSGTVRFIMSGQDALHWRQRTLENDQDEVKRQFNESVQNDFPDGVQGDFDHFLGLDDYNVNLIAFVKVSGNIATATGKHFFLPGLFFESRAKHPFVAEDKRTTPVDVHYAMMEQDDVTYHLPAGFTIESEPQAASTSWPNHAVLKISSVTNGDSVQVLRSLAYNYTLLDPKDYANLHDFYQKVAAADQQQLVLSRAQIAKGN
jgi:Domain of Unknown Function with PDB structure (DUF3857)/Transglutaminase-like superfamily